MNNPQNNKKTNDVLLEKSYSRQWKRTSAHYYDKSIQKKTDKFCNNSDMKIGLSGWENDECMRHFCSTELVSRKILVEF